MAGLPNLYLVIDWKCTLKVETIVTPKVPFIWNRLYHKHNIIKYLSLYFEIKLNKACVTCIVAKGRYIPNKFLVCSCVSCIIFQNNNMEDATKEFINWNNYNKYKKWPWKQIWVRWWCGEKIPTKNDGVFKLHPI